MAYKINKLCLLAVFLQLSTQATQASLHKTYSSAEELPDEYQFLEPLRADRQAHNTTFALPELSAEASKAREAWSPENLPKTSMIVCPLMGSRIQRSMNYYYGSGKWIQESGIPGFNAQDVIKYSPYFMLKFEPAFYGSLINLDYNTDKVRLIDQTLSPCGFIFEVPESCIVAVSEVTEDRLPSIRGLEHFEPDDLQAKFERKALTPFPSPEEILSLSLQEIGEDPKAGKGKFVPNINTVKFFSHERYTDKHIKLVGAFINEANNPYFDTLNIYNENLKFRYDVLMLAKKLNLKVVQIEDKKTTIPAAQVLQLQAFPYSFYNSSLWNPNKEAE